MISDVSRSAVSRSLVVLLVAFGLGVSPAGASELQKVSLRLSDPGNSSRENGRTSLVAVLNGLTLGVDLVAEVGADNCRVVVEDDSGSFSGTWDLVACEATDSRVTCRKGDDGVSALVRIYKKTPGVLRFGFRARGIGADTTGPPPAVGPVTASIDCGGVRIWSDTVTECVGRKNGQALNCKGA